MATDLKNLPLRPPKSPNLLLAPIEYDKDYTDQLNNALRIYFNQIDNFAQPFTSNTGGSYLRFPNGSFYDTTTQTAVATNTAYAMRLNSTATSNQVSVDPTHTSRIICAVAGIYNFQFSAQLNSSTGSTQYIYIWVRVNGADIPNSASKVAVQGSSAQLIAAWNFVQAMNAGDYLEFMWSVSNTSVNILAQTAVSPVPAIPSVIATATFVSALYP